VKKKRTKRKAGGFAAMDRARLRKIAREGGLAAHAEGKAHQFTSEEARRAGKIGGRSVSRDRKYMAEIGRRGGRARKGKGKGRRRRSR
jgi:general stress protein YciG